MCSVARRVGYENNTTPHLRIAPYKGSVTIVQNQMQIYVVGRSFRPSGGLYAPGSTVIDFRFFNQNIGFTNITHT